MHDYPKSKLSNQFVHAALGELRLQISVRRPADVVPGRERFLDDLQLMVHSGLEFEDYAAIADGLGLENYVALAVIGDRVAGVQCFHRH